MLLSTTMPMRPSVDDFFKIWRLKSLMSRPLRVARFQNFCTESGAESERWISCLNKYLFSRSTTSRLWLKR
ncbi:hypothetical protein D9M69_699540 [compost metagenome]